MPIHTVWLTLTLSTKTMCILIDTCYGYCCLYQFYFMPYCCIAVNLQATRYREPRKRRSKYQFIELKANIQRLSGEFNARWILGDPNSYSVCRQNAIWIMGTKRGEFFVIKCNFLNEGFKLKVQELFLLFFYEQLINLLNFNFKFLYSLIFFTIITRALWEQKK